MEVSGQLHTPAALSLVKEIRLPIRQEAEGGPESVWMLWREEKYLAPVGN
jgi:hypothetical protein